MTYMDRVIDDIKKKQFMTFDCYGTLIDWETGILNAIRPILNDIDDNKILELYAKFEAEAEKGNFAGYKTVLRRVMSKFYENYSTKGDEDILVEAIKNFKPFDDTVEALKRLQTNYKLGIISNVDNDLFEYTNRKLDIELSYLITSESVGSYKPSKNNFYKALEVMNAKPEDMVHVAQSIYHDIEPASVLGFLTVKVNRSNLRRGLGATLESDSKADINVKNLNELVSLIFG